MHWRLLPPSVSCRACTPSAETAKKEKDGKWETADGSPTYNIASDGTVDWYTFSGFRRYHSECHTCHGPDGEGSTYAPGLVGSLKTMSYPEFMLIVATGREVIRADKQSKMPALGDNRQREVLPRGHLRLPEGARGRRSAARAPGQAGRQARSRGQAREGLLR